MAYKGTTEASTVANPPILMAHGMARSVHATTVPQGIGMWYYASTDSSTLTMASNYFTDAYYIGMRQGDLLFGVQQTSQGSSFVCYMGCISAVTTAGANLSTGGTMTSTFS